MESSIIKMVVIKILILIIVSCENNKIDFENDLRIYLKLFGNKICKFHSREALSNFSSKAGENSFLIVSKNFKNNDYLKGINRCLQDETYGFEKLDSKTVVVQIGKLNEITGREFGFYFFLIKKKTDHFSFELIKINLGK
jgi:hypothetical protein